MTSGTGGYISQNMFNVLHEDEDDVEDTELVSTGNSLTHAAANATVNSGVTAPTAVSADVLTAINTLAANQATIVQQMVAFSLSASRPAHQAAAPAIHVPFVPQQSTTMQVPPVPAIHVTFIQQYNQGGGYLGGYTQGHGNRYMGYSGRSAGYHRCGRGRNSRNRYDPAGQNGAMVPYSGGGQGIPQVGGMPQAQRINPPHSNVTKRFSNWNACYSCGFDVANWHNSQTCNNRKPSHNEAYTHTNAQDFLNRGDQGVCTAGIHKTQLHRLGNASDREGRGKVHINLRI